MVVLAVLNRLLRWLLFPALLLLTGAVLLGLVVAAVRAPPTHPRMA